MTILTTVQLPILEYNFSINNGQKRFYYSLGSPVPFGGRQKILLEMPHRHRDEKSQSRLAQTTDNNKRA